MVGGTTTPGWSANHAVSPAISLPYIQADIFSQEGVARRAFTAHAQRRPSDSLYLSLGEWPRLPFTARIERPLFHRGGSASKKGTWPLSLPIFPSSFFPYLQEWPGLLPHRAHRGSTF